MADGRIKNGGKRDGAGRKQEPKTILFPVRMAPQTREALKELAKSKRGISVGEMLVRLALERKYREDFDS